MQAESSNKANPTDTNLKKIQEELEKEGKFGLIETDIYILKNVLEVLPKEHFSQTLAD